MLIRRIKQTNLLSFGPDSEEIELKRLNVLIGPNGSGKSNLLEGIDILRSAPRDLVAPIREGGGIHDWIWRGKPHGTACIEAIVENPQGPQALRYRLGFAERVQRFELIEERIENEQSDEGHEEPYIYYNQNGGQAFITYKDETGLGPTVEASVKEKYPHVRLRLGQYDLRPEEVKLDQSILSQRKDPDLPELTVPWRGIEPHSHLSRVVAWARFSTAAAAEGRPPRRFPARRWEKLSLGVKQLPR